MLDLSSLDPGGCPCYQDPTWCVCTATERVLRLYASTTPHTLPPLTEDQRAACVAEIVQFSEGARRENHAGDTDQVLCKSVLFAYQEYCRDKGLL